MQAYELGNDRLSVEAVTAGYGARNAVKEVTFGLRRGEFVGLLGPNGAGKSTLLRVLSHALPARTGRVLLEGEPLARMSARDIARWIAFVPQSETVLFDFTVRDVVLMGRHPHVSGLRGETAADYTAADRAMADADILPLRDRPVTSLSGGEYRRVLIARALAQTAPILLLDEPTAHLDLTHQIEVLRLARRLAEQEGACVCAALHDLNLAAEFCDRLLVLSEGRVAAEGTPEAVLNAPLLEQVYGRGLQVSRSPFSGKPFCFPAPEDTTPPRATTLRLHVVCGGGTGAGILAELARRGYRVTTGVLNRLDTDQEAAAALGLEYVEEPPFSPILPAARRACDALAAPADAVIVTDVPFGRGNLANLEMTAAAQAAGKPVFLFAADTFAERDFTDGRAAELWAHLLRKGAGTPNSLHALLDALHDTSCAFFPAEGDTRTDHISS